MKRILLGVSVLLILGVLAAACGATPTPEVVKETVVVEKEVVVTPTPAPVELPDKIVVGLLEPLTGSYAVFGSEARAGVEMAVKHINEAGGIQSMGGLQLELAVEDAGESADTAKLGAESLISKHDPVAVLGLFISRLTTAASEVTDREKVIMVADALVDDLTQRGRRYLFRPAPPASVHGASAVQFLADAAEEAGVTMEEIAILNEDSVFGRSVTTGANNAALDQGMTVVYRKEYPFDITDASSIVSEIQAAEPDAVVHAPYFQDAIVFANTFEETGAKPKFIAGAGATGYTDPDSIEALGEVAEYYANTFSYNPAKDTPQNRKFVEDFRAEHGKIPTEAAGMNYYGMWVLKEALELSGELFPNDPLNPDNLREAFLQLDLTSGPAVETYPSDHIAFDGKGDNPYAKAVILQVLDGEPKVVWPFEDAEAEAVFPRPGASY